MKQLIQHIRSGESAVLDVPAPRLRAHTVRIQLGASLVSAGTERMVIDFAQKSLLEKARARPDLVRKTYDKAKREGILATIDSVRNRLDQPMALGYSAAGTVIEVSPDVADFKPGDRVAVAGGGSAAHAEVVVAPVNLVVKIPSAVDFDSAAFTTLGAIALQGVRLAEVKLGETVAVIGLGLLGQLTVQLLRAAGCRVIGFDPQEGRARLGRTLGAEAAVAETESFVANCARITAGRGVDAVLIAAETSSNEPVTVAGTIARDKGVVVAVGAVGFDLPRKAYFEKELDFRVSRSYGPGRYDPSYEEDGHDYPFGYVRWTENRNMQAFVQLLAEGRVDTSTLITHRLPIADGVRAYEIITGETKEDFLGVVLTYPQDTQAVATRVNVAPVVPQPASDMRIGLIGAGNFATAVLIPFMRRTKAPDLVGVCTASGISARSVADRFGFRYCTTDPAEILADDTINVVAIATRHHLHARQTLAALEAGKSVFVEKPLCVTVEELAQIRQAYEAQKAAGRPIRLMVGYNRRFAPMAIELKDFFATVAEPLMLQYRVNAGRLPLDHWTQDPAQGGGRLIGEGVHFIDFAQWMCGSLPTSVYAAALPDSGRYRQDNLTLTVRFENGSVAQILYLANGDRAAGKERVEVNGGGRTAVLDDFKVLHLTKDGRITIDKSRFHQDKGHAAEWVAFDSAVRSGAPSPIPFAEIDHGMRTAFAALTSLTTGLVVPVQ